MWIKVRDIKLVIKFIKRKIISPRMNRAFYTGNAVMTALILRGTRRGRGRCLSKKLKSANGNDGFVEVVVFVVMVKLVALMILVTWVLPEMIEISKSAR